MLPERFIEQNNDRPELSRAYGIYAWIANSDKF